MQRCHLRQPASEFNNFEAPFIYTPGDNEWTDCHRENNGSFDPIERLTAHLVVLGEWDADRDEALDKEIDATVRAAQKEAEAMGTLPQQGFDNIPSMFHDVYNDTPWHLAEQCEQAMDEAREYLGHEPK